MGMLMRIGRGRNGYDDCGTLYMSMGEVLQSVAIQLGAIAKYLFQTMAQNTQFSPTQGR